MMRFLKSTLFPDNLKASKNTGDKKSNLEKRVLTLESEVKDKEAQIEELRTYIESMAVIVSSLSSDLYTIASALASPKEKTTTKDIFSMYKIGDDDDDGYLH